MLIQKLKKNINTCLKLYTGIYSMYVVGMYVVGMYVIGMYRIGMSFITCL